MAYQEIKIGNSTIPMRASAATPYFYKSIFKQDLLKYLANKKNSFSNIENSENTEELDENAINNGLDIIDLTNKLAFVMAMQADNSVKMNTLNMDSFLEWLDNQEPNALEDASGNILDLYFDTTKSDSSQKKKNDL